MKPCLETGLEASALLRGWDFNLAATGDIEQLFMGECGLLTFVTPKSAKIST